MDHHQWMWSLMVWTTLLCGLISLLKWGLSIANEWLHEIQLGEAKYRLPPGDYGLPLVGNMWSFLRAFKSTNPDSFISSFISRFGNGGIYKAFMFGKPSVIVITSEACRRVLTDDDAFKPGWPVSTMKLIGEKSFIGISYEEHKRLRRLTAAPINGHEALSVYLKYIDDIVQSSLEKFAKMGEFEVLTELRRMTFKIIMYIFLGSESDEVSEHLEKEYTTLNHGVRAMAINLPGFAYFRAMKARKRLVDVFQSIVDDRRERKRNDSDAGKKRDMMDVLMDVEDENGRKLTDEEIIDVLVMYLNAGHESSGHTIMWTVVFLQQHPEIFQKAKEEQEEIIRIRPPTQEGLTLKEYRQMEYLSKVIDETLRVVSFSFVVFREAKMDVNISGYTIPKGWRVLPWFRAVHMTPEIYPNPMTFDPSRWDDYTPKPGTFLPFGAGSRLCPGNDLAKLEISIFLHYFLLQYELVRKNPKCANRYLPHPRPVDNCLGRIRKVSSTS